MNYKYQGLITELGVDRVKINEPMSKHTYFKLGGAADLFYEAKSTGELTRAVELVEKYEVQWFVLGGGSNILVGDLGIRGLVIKNEARQVRHENLMLIAESGALLNQVVNYANRNGLAGLANYFSIPGTIGGAIFNNSHGWPDSKELIGNWVEKAAIWDNGEEKDVKREWFDFVYDGSKLQNYRAVLLNVTFKLKKGNPAELKETSLKAADLRKQKQPIGVNSAGCVFANPEGDSAGRLIDLAGLKGKKMGGAEISTIHANFIVNRDNASVKEVLELMALVKNKIKERFKVDLKPEIFLAGEFSSELKVTIKDINFKSRDWVSNF